VQVSDAQKLVADFHRMFNHPAPSKYTTKGYRYMLRKRLVLEEAMEFGEACEEMDPVAMVDALCDLLYVTLGSAVELGVDLAPFFLEVHRTNMNKVDANGEPIWDTQGKTLKPANWEPPRIAQMLRELEGK